MTLFVIIFITIYTLMHAMVFWGVSPLLHGHRLLTVAIIVWMFFMISAPILIHVLDGNGNQQEARMLAFTGYSWMGFAFLAFSMFTVIAALEIGRFLFSLAVADLHRFSFHTVSFSLSIVLIALIASIYGYFEARTIRVEKISIQTEKIGNGRDTLRIAQISDLHLGLIHREATVAKVLQLLEEINPDMVVATGDMVDAQIDHLNGLSDLWKNTDPPLGKYAILGNHEVYAGLGQSLSFLHQSGFTVLRNEGVTPGNIVKVIGIDDEHVRGFNSDERILLKENASSLFTIFLKHRPDAPVGGRLFDLQLSGHAHRGQIFPFNLLTGLRFPMQDGLYSLPEGGRLYASRGTGTWGPPMRLFSPPEISVFEISFAKHGKDR
ncbi:MAG: metallophosphoesterase [Pseudomonadota bacterium]